MVVIIENLSEITAGSPMVGTPIILVQRPIKDLCIMPLRPKTSEMVKEQERKVEPPGIEPRATGIPCHCSDFAQILNDHNYTQLISSSNQ